MLILLNRLGNKYLWFKGLFIKKNCVCCNLMKVSCIRDRQTADIIHFLETSELYLIPAVTQK